MSREERGASIASLTARVHLHRCAHIGCARPWRTCGPISPTTSGAVHGTGAWKSGSAGSRLLPMRNQFQFRAGSPPAMPVAKAARASPWDYLGKTERASQRYLVYTCFLRRSFNASNVYTHARLGFSAHEVEGNRSGWAWSWLESHNSFSLLFSSFNSLTLSIFSFSIMTFLYSFFDISQCLRKIQSETAFKDFEIARIKNSILLFLIFLNISKR